MSWTVCVVRIALPSCAAVQKCGNHEGSYTSLTAVLSFIERRKPVFPCSSLALARRTLETKFPKLVVFSFRSFAMTRSRRSTRASVLWSSPATRRHINCSLGSCLTLHHLHAQDCAREPFRSPLRGHSVVGVCHDSFQNLSEIPQALQSRKYFAPSLRTRTPLPRRPSVPHAEQTVGIRYSFRTHRTASSIRIFPISR